MKRAEILSKLQTREIHSRELDYLSLSSVSEGIDMAREIPDHKLRAWDNGSWNGLGSQPIRDYWLASRAEAPLKLFNEAQGKIDHSLTLGGALIPSVAGGAWVMPLVIQGNPLCSRQKTRSKLAPLHLTLDIELLAYGDSGILAKCAATVARALRQYTLDGGIASLTVRHWSDYAIRNKPGICIETQVNVADENALALVVSPVYARATLYPLMDWISTEKGSDHLPFYKNKGKLGGWLAGEVSDFAYLKSKGIEVQQ